MTLVGRAQLDHPALGAAGGSALHASIESIYTVISNDMAGRYSTYSSIANSTLTTVTHNFGVQFSDLKVYVYTGTFPALTRVSDPAASGWTIAATSGFLQQKIDVTTPGSGGPHTFALMITHGRGAEKLKDLDDINTTAPIDGQLLIYDTATSKWIPAYLKYKSETAAIASNTLTPTTGANIQRITSGAADLQMIASPVSGKVYVLVNETGTDFLIKNDTGGTAANRFYTGTGSDLALKNNAAVTVIYNSGLTRWVISGGSGGGGLQPVAKTANFTAEAGNNYLTDTTSGAIAVTLPSGANGSTMRFIDATEKWGTNNLTITPASGQTIDMLAANEALVCDVNRGWVELSWDGSRWAFSSLASTTVGEASASAPGIVSTGAQSFAGNKTWNGSLTPSGGIIGKTDGVAVAAGKVGEIYTTSFTGGALTTGVAGRSAIINLPSAGTWLIFCTSVFTGTATTMTQRRSSIGTSDSLNFTLAATNSYEAGYESFNPSAVVDPGKALSPIFINSSSAPTVYVWSAAVFSGGSLNNYGYITAIRVAA